MSSMLSKPVQKVMTKEVKMVTQDQTIKEVFALLKKHDIVGVPVVDEHQKVVGMVTESDLIKHFTTLDTPRAINVLGGLVYLDDISEFNQQLKEHCSEWVKDLMTTDVVTVGEDSTVQDVVNAMEEHDVNRIPVVDSDHHLVGIVTRKDLLKHLT